MNDSREEVSVAERRELLDAAFELADLCAATTASIVDTGFEVSTKADESIVTTADMETERAFRERVRERFPEMDVLGEEFGRSVSGSDYCWIIDPIDGTAEFARHVPLYGCILGLFYKGRPLLGVIDHRAMDLRCHGVFGLGAFCNGQRLQIEDCTPREAGATARIGLPSRASFLKPTDCAHVFDAIVDAYPNFRTYHTCYAHLLTAAQGFDAAMEWDTPLWDLAAAQIVIEEAGGCYQPVRDFEVPGEGQFYTAVFGKPAVVERLVAIIEERLRA